MPNFQNNRPDVYSEPVRSAAEPNRQAQLGDLFAGLGRSGGFKKSRLSDPAYKAYQDSIQHTSYIPEQGPPSFEQWKAGNSYPGGAAGPTKFNGGGAVPPQMGEGGGNMAVPPPGADNLAVQGITSGAGGKPVPGRNVMTAGPGRGMMPFPGRGAVPPTPISGGPGAAPVGSTPAGGGGPVPPTTVAPRPTTPYPRPGGQVGGNAGGAGSI